MFTLKKLIAFVTTIIILGMVIFAENYKTFSNSEFSIDYPSGWTHDFDDDGDDEFSDDDDNSLTVSSEYIGLNISASLFVESLKEQYEDMELTIREEGDDYLITSFRLFGVTVCQYTAVKVINKKAWMFIGSTDEDNLRKCTKIFKNMINSFAVNK